LYGYNLRRQPIRDALQTGVSGKETARTGTCGLTDEDKTAVKMDYVDFIKYYIDFVQKISGTMPYFCNRLKRII
jgi:hypothetical protein